MIKLTYKGESLTLNQWAAKTGLTQQTIRRRMERGHSEAVCLGVEPWGKLSKNEEEMRLNDLDFASIPSVFQKLIKSMGYTGKKYGTIVRTRSRAEFDKWFEGLTA